MSAEILNSYPISGKYPEIYFGNNYINSLWVEFEDNNLNQWYGCFPNNPTQAFNKVLIDRNNKSAFVISSGIGYLINIATKKLIFKTEDNSHIESAIATENPNYFAIGTSNSVYILDSNSLIQKVIPNFMTDGIYFKNQQGNKAIGNLLTAKNHYECSVDFEFDLKSFELTMNHAPITFDFLSKLWTIFQSYF